MRYGRKEVMIENIEKYFDMLIKQSRLNEEKGISFGVRVDSVADKLQGIKQQILDNQKLRELIKKGIKELPECSSKECMGCEWDLVRNKLQKLLEESKK